jgi:lipoate-protein ligase A
MLFAEWRLVFTGPADGYVNMAIDEATLTLVRERRVPPTVRIYSWAEPCFTIGYLQRISHLHPALPRHTECKCVRRLTGGRACLHGGDLSYSLTVSVADTVLPANIVASYERISSGVIEGLRLLGVDARYAAPTEVQMEGRAIATAAQARRQGVLLHQGTIALRPSVLDAEQVLPPGQALTPISELGGGEIDLEEGAHALGMGLERALGVDLSPSILFAKEKRLARQLWREKYMRPEWNLSR